MAGTKGHKMVNVRLVAPGGNEYRKPVRVKAGEQTVVKAKKADFVKKSDGGTK
jgi:hypothetical protein